MNKSSAICNVGYCLNKKKLRKSAVALGVDVDPVSPMHKWTGGGLSDIIHSSEHGDTPVDGVKFTPFDWKNANCQPHLDVIIHKLTEDLEKDEPSEKILALKSYLRSHPSTRLVDPLEAVRVVTSRERSCLCMSAAAADFAVGPVSYTLNQPRHFVFRGALDSANFLHAMKDAGLVFPIICKPLVACGAPEAHLMVVVVRSADLHMIHPPCLVQQYVDHGRALFKVYVLGQDVTVFQRPSLPDIASHLSCSDTSLELHASDCICLCHGGESSIVYAVDTNSFSKSPKRHRNTDLESDTTSVSSDGGSACGRCSFSSVRSVEFDSRLEYPTATHFNIQTAHPSDDCTRSSTGGRLRVITSEECSEEPHWPVPQECSDGPPLPVPLECFAAAARLMQDHFHLSLFGFDVILSQYSSSTSSGDRAPESATSTLTVVDVNYFPSYKEVSDFPQRLRALLRTSATSNPPPSQPEACKEERTLEHS